MEFIHVEAPEARSGALVIPAYSFEAGELLHSPTNSYGHMRRLLEMARRKELPADSRLSYAHELRAVDLHHGAGMYHNTDPRSIPEFAGYFGRGGIYIVERTATVLRAPDERWLGRKDGKKYIREVVLVDFNTLRELPDDFSDDNLRDIVREADVTVGEVRVPYSDWYVVKEFDEVSGVPTEVENTRLHNTPHAIHFRFNPNPEKDPISGYYDVAVQRRGGWHRGEDGRCLYVVADWERSGAGSDGGFRPVRGSFEIINKLRFG